MLVCLLFYWLCLLECWFVLYLLWRLSFDVCGLGLLYRLSCFVDCWGAYV